MHDGVERIVGEWVSEWAALSPAELLSFGERHSHDAELERAVAAVLEERAHAHLLAAVCAQLLAFLRADCAPLPRFALQFAPSVAWAHCAEPSPPTETLLLAMYNLCAMAEVQPACFRVASLAQASPYHEPLALAPAFLTEAALRRWEECERRPVAWGPPPPLAALTRQNRLAAVAALLCAFNASLAAHSPAALRRACSAASRLASRGFGDRGAGRLPVSAPLLLQLAHAAHFALYHGCQAAARQALDDIAARAAYEGYADVLLVTEAVAHSLRHAPHDRPMGIGVALSPAADAKAASKAIITNASFRTKKLPDDIPIQTAPPADAEPLDAIAEEAEPEQRFGQLRSSKSKLPSLAGLGKKLKDAKRSSHQSPSMPKRASADAAEPDDSVDQGSATDSLESDAPKRTSSMQVSSV